MMMRALLCHHSNTLVGLVGLKKYVIVQKSLLGFQNEKKSVGFVCDF